VAADGGGQGGLGSKTPSFQQDDPRDSCKSELFWMGEGVKGASSVSKLTTTRSGPSSSDNLVSPLIAYLLLPKLKCDHTS